MAATESDKVSYSNLVRFTKLSAKFSPASTSGKHFDIQLHYRDEDGDDVLFTTDIELVEALHWATVAADTAGEDAKLCVHADLIPAKGPKNYGSARLLQRMPSNSSTVSHSSTRSLQTFRNEADLCSSNSSARSLPVQSVAKVTEGSSPQCTPLDIEMPQSEQGKKKKSKKPLAELLRKLLTPPPPLIKTPDESSCPNTSSNVGEALVCGLADMLGSAVMMIEAQEIATQGKLASLHSERAIKKGVEHMTALRRADGNGGYKCVVLLIPSPDTNFDPTFIHKRHSCDGCHQDPIIGSRYHAIPNIDLCQRCFDTALTLHADEEIDDEERKPSAVVAQNNDETIVFEMAQHKSDQGMIHSKFAHMLLRVRQGLKNMAASQKQKTNSSSEKGGGYERTALEGSTRVSDFDVAFAIQKSLQDLRKQNEKSNQELRDDDTHGTVESTLSTAELLNEGVSMNTRKDGIGEDWCVVGS